MLNRSAQRTARLALAAASATAPVLMLAAAPAHADPFADCAAPVIDSTDAKVLDSASVTTRVLDLRGATGADVYVRAFQSTPGGSAAAWWQDTYRSCPGWLGADGRTPKPNLLVVQFGLDRTSAIQYGANFHQLDSNVDRMRADMGTYLRNSDFTGAVTSTLVELGGVLQPPAARPAGPVPAVAAPDSEPSTSIESAVRGMIQLAIAIIVLIGTVLICRQILIGLRALSRRRQRAEAARRRLDEAVRTFASARSDMAAAARTSSAEKAKARASAAAEDAEGAVDPDAFTELLSRRDDLRGEANRPLTLVDAATESEVLARASTLTRIAEQLRAIDRDADALADKAEVTAAGCTPERKRADLQDEVKRLEKQFAAMNVAGIDLSDQRARVEAKRDELAGLAEAIAAGNVPVRPDIDAALSGAAQVRSVAADAVTRAGHAISELRYVRDRVARIVEQYSQPVPGVSGESAERAVVAAFEVARAADATEAAIPAEGAQLDTLVPQVEELRRAARAATEEVDRQIAKHQAEERRNAEQERRQRQASRQRSSTSHSAGYGSDYASGLVTGAVLGSLGSSSSSSSSSFGGGGYSGGGGGGDFGGGSSGSW